MQSIFKLNRARRAKLRVLLKCLFPEYEYMHINSVGVITFKRKWYSLKRYQNTLVELCYTLIPQALSNYRRADASYMFLLKNYIDLAISSKASHIVDFLYSEFQKTIKLSKVDDLLEMSCLSLPMADEAQETIGIIVQTSLFSRPIHNVGSKLKETISLLANASYQESKKAQKERLGWL